MITFQQVSRLWDKSSVSTAAAAVEKHGSKGAGDSFGAKFILACEANYVATCLKREIAANPSNSQAREVCQALMSHLS